MPDYLRELQERTAEASSSTQYAWDYDIAHLTNAIIDVAEEKIEKESGAGRTEAYYNYPITTERREHLDKHSEALNVAAGIFLKRGLNAKVRWNGTAIIGYSLAAVHPETQPGVTSYHGQVALRTIVLSW